jgi:hypothetical protein
MDDDQIQSTLARVAPVSDGQTIGQVIDSALATVDALTLKALIDARGKDNIKAAALASAPAIPAPESPEAVYAFLLTGKSEPDYAAAYLALRRAAEGASASPPTHTWDDVARALLYLATAVRAATPHLEGM